MRYEENFVSARRLLKFFSMLSVGVKGNLAQNLRREVGKVSYA